MNQTSWKMVAKYFLPRKQGGKVYKLSNSLTRGGVTVSEPLPNPPESVRTEKTEVNQTPEKPAPKAKEAVPESELAPNPAEVALKRGTYLYAELSGKWIPVEVIGLQDGGKIKIHWLGMKSTWDTSPERESLRVKQADLESLSATAADKE